MKLSRPKNITWLISVILGIIGLLGKLGIITLLAPYAFWVVFAGLALLVLGTLFKNI
jgi:predicted membrane channel-forming protein YqfA (hemolysin III family)